MELLYTLLAALFGALFAAFFTRRIEQDLLRQSLRKAAYDQIITEAEAAKQALLLTWATFDRVRTVPVALRNAQRQGGGQNAKPSQEVQELWSGFLNEANDNIFKAATAFGKLQTQLENYAFMYKPLAGSYHELFDGYGQLLEAQNNVLDKIRDLDFQRLAAGDEQAAEAVDINAYKAQSDAFTDKVEAFQLALQHYLFGRLFK